MNSQTSSAKTVALFGKTCLCLVHEVIYTLSFNLLHFASNLWLSIFRRVMYSESNVFSLSDVRNGHLRTAHLYRRHHRQRCHLILSFEPRRQNPPTDLLLSVSIPNPIRLLPPSSYKRRSSVRRLVSYKRPRPFRSCQGGLRLSPSMTRAAPPFQLTPLINTHTNSYDGPSLD